MEMLPENKIILPVWINSASVMFGNFAKIGQASEVTPRNQLACSYFVVLIINIENIILLLL